MIELAIIAGILSVFSFLFASYALIELKAMQKSTHRVTFYDPTKQEFTPLTELEKKKLSTEPFDNI